MTGTLTKHEYFGKYTWNINKEMFDDDISTSNSPFQGVTKSSRRKKSSSDQDAAACKWIPLVALKRKRGNEGKTRNSSNINQINFTQFCILWIFVIILYIYNIFIYSYTYLTPFQGFVNNIWIFLERMRFIYMGMMRMRIQEKNTIVKLSNQTFAVQLIILDSVVKQYVDNIIYRPIYMTLS